MPKRLFKWLFGGRKTVASATVATQITRAPLAKGETFIGIVCQNGKLVQGRRSYNLPPHEQLAKKAGVFAGPKNLTDGNYAVIIGKGGDGTISVLPS